MKFKTCNCDKYSTRCIKTGFSFSHEGFTRAGDLFLCRCCGALTIHGVPEGKAPDRPGTSSFTGLLVCQDESYGGSEAGGIIDLNEQDLNYVLHCSEDIKRFAIE